MLNWLKRTWMWLALIIGAVAFYGDPAQLATTAYRLSAIALILLVVDFMLDSRAGKGVFPSLDLDAALRKAIGTPIGAALVWCGYVALVIAIIAFSVGK